MSNSFEYQGESFPLNREYADYDEFKHDPNNFDANQVKQIDELLRRAPSPAVCHSQDELSQTISDLIVPGYGLTSSPSNTSKGLVLMYSIEIPKAKKERILVYLQHKSTNSYIRLDDFVAGDRFGPADIQIEGNKLNYVGRWDKKALRQIDLPDSASK